MPKIKSTSQQLEQESLSELRRVIVKKGWNFIQRHHEDDFGVDGLVELFIRKKGKYIHTHYSFQFQLKSTSSGKNTRDFSLTDLNTWRRSLIPFFLFFWNKTEDKFYWINLQEFCRNLELNSSEKFKQKYLRINFENELNRNSLDLIKKKTKSIYKAVEKTIKDNANKQVAAEELVKREGPIVALGYSDKNADLSKIDMKRATMMGFDFKNAALSNKDMRSGAFMGAIFSGANLDGADLRGCSFMGAFFDKAKLRSAKLQGAAFMGAFVGGADFSGAEWDDVSLWSISKSYDLEKAKFDEGILDKIAKLGKTDNLSVSNLAVANNKQDSFVLDKWIAVKTDDEQGADYRHIPRKGKSLEKISFNIRPISPFWRAGLKIIDPNSSVLPLGGSTSILFHLGSTERINYFGITAYINGEHVGSVNKTFKFVSNQPITISFEVNQKNFIKFFVNEAIEFEPGGRISPRLLKKVYLVAWGDSNDYKVEFDEIRFSPRGL